MSKYNAKRVIIDGFTFDSLVEAKYYMENKNNIIKVHPKYLLQEKFEINGDKIREINYEGDFLVNIGGKKVVIDIKGMPTQEALLKRKLFIYKYPEIQLLWLVYVKKRGGRLDFFENKRLMKKEKTLS